MRSNGGYQWNGLMSVCLVADGSVNVGDAAKVCIYIWVFMCVCVCVYVV